MTLATSTASITLAGDGVTTAFGYNFIIPYQDDGVTPAVQVTYTNLLGINTILSLGVDYTITGVNNPAGGTVTYNPGTPIPVGTLLTIERNLSATQPFAVGNQSFLPATVEKSADHIMEVVQQLLNSTSRAIHYPTADTTNPTIITKANRANTIFGWDALGNPKYYASSTTIVGLNGAVPVEDFGAVGNGIVDDTAAIQLAFNSAEQLLFSATKNYAISAPIIIPANRLMWAYGSIISALPGFVGNCMLVPGTGLQMFGGELDGTNMPQPTASWLGVGIPVGSAFSGDGTTTACDDGRLHDVVFANFPSGPIFMRQCHRWEFDKCRMVGNQTYLTHITNANLEIYHSDDNRIVDLDINGYSWKGININGARNKIVRPHAYGPGQNSGNATFYEDGATDSVWDTMTHEGIGFFFKAHASTRCTVINAKGDGTIYAQFFTDFKVFGGTLILPDTANQAVILEGIATIPGVAGGPGDTFLIDGLTARRVNPGTTSNHVFIRLAADVACPVQNGRVVNCVCENMLYGLWAAGINGTVVDDIDFSHNTMINTVQYDVLSYANSLKVKFNRFVNTGANALPSIATFSPIGGTGKLIDIAGNTFSGRTGDYIDIGVDNSNTFATKFSMVRIVDNYFETGNVTINFDISNTAAGGTNQVDLLVVGGNVGHSVGAAGGMTLTFHTVQKTFVNVFGNTLLSSTGFSRNIAITNGAQISGGYVQDHGTINDVTGRPNNVSPLSGTAPPATGSYPKGTLFSYNNVATGLPALAVNYTAGGANFQTVVANQP